MKDRLTQPNLLPVGAKPSEKNGFTPTPQARALRRILCRIFRPLCTAVGFAARRAQAQMRDRLTRSPAVQSPHTLDDRSRRSASALPQVQLLLRIHRYFQAYPAMRFGLCLLLIAAIEIPLCLRSVDTVHDPYTYLLVAADGTEIIRSSPAEDRELPHLTVSSDAAPSDVQLILHRGSTVTVCRGADRYSVKCRRETVANLLRRLNVEVSANEMISVNVAGASPLIRIGSELRFERTEQTFSPYNTRTYSNYLLEKGTYQIIQEGKPGCITETYEDVYRSGKLTSSHLIARSDDSAVTQIVEYGHLVHTMEQDMRAVKDHPFRDGSGGGYLVFENGDSMLYTKKIVNDSTAYYGGTRTYTGHSVGIGVIAVDPDVYPFHTSMYIGSVSGGIYYGIGTAYDRGGAVKGNIIDVWFPTYSDCVPWGRRDVTCYILQDTNVT